MTLSMYQASVPVLSRGLDLLAMILKQGEAHQHGAALVEARLAPDMLSLAGQVQRASDTAKGCIARLASVDNPKFDDSEKSFADLYARIAKTVGFLKSVPREQIDGTGGKVVAFKAGPNTFNFTGEHYLLAFVLPNFFFHMTTAYAILRHHGVPLQKRDYLGHDLFG